MTKPDRALVDEETRKQGEIDHLDLSPTQKLKARDAVRKELDEQLDTGRAPTPAHE